MFVAPKGDGSDVVPEDVAHGAGNRGLIGAVSLASGMYGRTGQVPVPARRRVAQHLQREGVDMEW